jgi:hypothetical protein
MARNRLTEVVLRRLKELGLPPCLLDLGEIRDKFFFRRWVMLVRDGDKVADVHLFQPRPNIPLARQKDARSRKVRRDR